MPNAAGIAKPVTQALRGRRGPGLKRAATHEKCRAAAVAGIVVVSPALREFTNNCLDATNTGVREGRDCQLLLRCAPGVP